MDTLLTAALLTGTKLMCGVQLQHFLQAQTTSKLGTTSTSCGQYMYIHYNFLKALFEGTKIRFVLPNTIVTNLKT